MEKSRAAFDAIESLTASADDRSAIPSVRTWATMHAFVLACVFLCGWVSRVPAQNLPQEREVQAVLLFRLTQFITWPAANSNQPPEFVIGILGPDPFGTALEAAVAGEKVGDRPIRIVRSNRTRDLTHCQMVYVSPAHRQPLARTFEELNQQPVLTVGETEDFLAAGGVIRFKRTPERKTRLQIQLTRARQKAFTVSAQLLRVCDIVDGGYP